MSNYKIDPAHSEILFKLKHLMITNVTGSFSKFDAGLMAERENFTDAVISFEADVSSISTNNTQRDAHLRGDDFFNVEQFPKLSFASTGIESTGEKEFKLSGNLTIRNVTKPIFLNVAYIGNVTDSWGQQKAGFELSGKISRSEFGLNWNNVTEAGGIVVSDEVRLLLSIQMIKQVS